MTAPDGRILLVKTEKSDWEPPGGQVELGEDLVSGLQREILVEAGVRVDVGRLVSVSSNVQPPAEKVILTFLCVPHDMDVGPQGEAGCRLVFSQGSSSEGDTSWGAGEATGRPLE